MKKFLLLIVIMSQAFGMACSLSQHAQTVVQRQPMEKQQHEYKTPTEYKPRVSGYDKKTGQEITYDHKPRIELLDAKSRKYAMKWIGLDGGEKTATFQRADAVDVIVSATVSRTSGGQYEYTYEVQNLPSSGAFLKRFLVQNFAPDVEPEKSGDMMPFRMSKDIQGFGEGSWLNFADVSDDVQVDPGQAVKIKLVSSAPPGLVQCRASAQTLVEGADEEMPSDLEELLVGYNEYLRGYTIGPDERIKKLSTDERAQYLLDKLPQFRKLGWLTEATSRSYEQQLKNANLEAIAKQAEADVKAGLIAPEVLSIVQAMR